MPRPTTYEKEYNPSLEVATIASAYMSRVRVAKANDGALSVCGSAQAHIGQMRDMQRELILHHLARMSKADADRAMRTLDRLNHNRDQALI